MSFDSYSHGSIFLSFSLEKLWIFAVRWKKGKLEKFFPAGGNSLSLLRTRHQRQQILLYSQRKASAIKSPIWAVKTSNKGIPENWRKLYISEIYPQITRKAYIYKHLHLKEQKIRFDLGLFHTSIRWVRFWPFTSFNFAAKIKHAPAQYFRLIFVMRFLSTNCSK